MGRELARYDAAASRAACQIIAAYSTSFSMAARLLRGQMRRDICHLYAMVRTADEMVDGAAEGDIGKLLSEYEEAVVAAPGTRFHADPVLHAYAMTARRCGFREEHVRAFFASMRADLERSACDAASLDRYIYGSAEVVGLLCLDVFFAGNAPAELEEGARRLGAAFQKVNFLRDCGYDAAALGRTYYANVDEAAKARLVAEIEADLAAARATFPALPLAARAGVMAAASLFAELNAQIARTPAAVNTAFRAAGTRTLRRCSSAAAAVEAARL